LLRIFERFNMKTKNLSLSLVSFFFSFVILLKPSLAISLENGEKIFLNNCSVCHIGGNNIIIPEKNLKKETLEANGMNTISAISYQVLNGKNGMPAFGGRLTQIEIEEVANYVLEKSLKNFQE
jgi:cytochrome c6